MHKTRTLSLAEIEDLALRACVGGRASKDNIRPLVVATVATEADDVASHGLAYIPIYCEHVRCGKVDGQALPIRSLTSALRDLFCKPASRASPRWR